VHPRSSGGGQADGSRGLAQINESIIVRTLEPVVQQTNRFLIANWIRTIQARSIMLKWAFPWSRTALRKMP
jgi:hypothetical protein